MNTIADLIKQSIAKRTLLDWISKLGKTKEAKMLAGYKTYIVAAFLIAAAALKMIAGIEIPSLTDTTDPGFLITTALGLVFARNGAKTEVKKL